MRLNLDDLTPAGADGIYLHSIDTIFLVSMLPQKLGVAVSGGGDSMALLHMCIRWGRLAGVTIEAVTVNHGLRAAATDEAAMVTVFCADAGITHTTLNWDGTKVEGNVQAAARDARYAMMADWAKGRDIGHIMLGHTADDVAETFLMRLARKSGVNGLAAMDAQFNRHNVQWARPLWQQTRADLRDYLQRHGVSWIEDPSNEDLTQTRPKARKILEALAPLGITVEGLKTTAHALAMSKGALEHFAYQEAQRVVTFEAGDVIIPTRSRPPVHPETQRRLHLAAVQYVNGAHYPPREISMIQLDAALSAQDRHTVAGCLVSKVEGGLRFARELNAVAPPVVWTNSQPRILWDGRWEISDADDDVERGDLIVRALGDALPQVPDWRELGIPRASLVSSPAIFMNEQLISAPIAGLHNGFSARIVADYTSFLLSR